jgi:hypothetical protein
VEVSFNSCKFTQPLQNQNIGTRQQLDRDDAGGRDKTQIAANSSFAGQQEARHFGEAQRA